MNNVSGTLGREKQNLLSAGLIFLNIILAVIYFNCVPQSEDAFFMSLLAVGIFAVVLMALFVFTYRGKAPLVSKWILALCIVITLIYGLFIGYATALGKAFQH